jgi:hypothetical protein
MRIRHGYFTAILGSVAATIAVAAAPIATAAPSASATTPQQACAGNGAGRVCQSPGNVQIDDAPPSDQFDPYAGEAFLP